MIIENVHQFGSEDFRRTISHLNGIKARKYSGEWRWNIDLARIDENEIAIKLASFEPNDVVHFKNLLKKLAKSSATAAIPQRIQETPAAYSSSFSFNPPDSFDTFLAKISARQSADSTVYTVIGDIIDGYKYREHFFQFTFLDSHNDWKTIQLTVNEYTKGKSLNFDALNNTRVQVSGKVKFYPKRAALELVAQSIKVLGMCSRLEEYERYEKECSAYFHTKEEQNAFTLNTLTHVGLISGESNGKPIQGATDFIAQLPMSLKDSYLYKKYVRISDVQQIVTAIHELNAEGECQVIAIVRGGGSAESLACYSDPALVKAIYQSRIPVITGIGHHSDQSLCERAACRDCGTPTGAGNFIRRTYFKIHLKTDYRQRDRYQSKTEYDRILASATKEELLLENADLKNEVQFLQQENEELQNKLDRMKHRGLLSRILNLG